MKASCSLLSNKVCGKGPQSVYAAVSVRSDSTGVQRLVNVGGSEWMVARPLHPCSVAQFNLAERRPDILKLTRGTVYVLSLSHFKSIHRLGMSVRGSLLCVLHRSIMQKISRDQSRRSVQLLVNDTKHCIDQQCDSVTLNDNESYRRDCITP